jgi:hypothetical protein
MSLLEWAAIAVILNFIISALLTIIDRWPQIFKWGKPYLPKIALIFLIFGVISAGVSLKEASKKTYVLPPLGEEAVLKTELMPRPRLEPFTEAEFKAIPITAKGKILRYVVNVTAYMDVADAAVEGHKNYERSIFGGKKTK